MNVYFDESQLSGLLESFGVLCGIRIGALGSDGSEICASGRRADICGECEGCICRGSRGADGGVQFVRCHEDACAAMFPIRSSAQSEPLAWLCAGPVPEEGEVRDALVGVLEALAECIQHRNLIWTAGETDLQRLAHFLDEHYMDKLSLSAISAQLHIGRTRLCALAKQLSGGRTLSYMIAQRRIERAKALLVQSDSSVSAVAEAVGISDYNYFSKVFRSAVGVTPSEFRKQARRAQAPQEGAPLK